MLKLQNVSKYYHSNDVVAMGLRKVSLSFELGEFVAVTGESGSGKSTLLNVISGLDTYEDGEMYVSGEETSYFSVEDWENYRKQYIGFVFQNYNIIDSYTVLDNVLLALTVQGYDKATRKQRALELIDKVGLSSHVNHKASKLSGGQKQRAVIARALAKDCPIIVADEPTGNLDRESSKKVIELLQEIAKDKLVIVVTHNYEEIEEYATRKIRLFDGEVVEDKILKKSNKSEVIEESKITKMTYFDLMKVAAKNLLRTPRRAVFTVVVSIFIVAVFIFGYGGYLSITNEVGFRYNRYFRNVTESRIIVTKFDNTAFTDAELNTLEKIDKVIDLIEDDVLFDTYAFRYYRSPWGGEGYESREGYVNPALILDESVLSDGRLPRSKYEVVIESGLDNIEDYEVGDTIYFGSSYFYSNDNNYVFDENQTFKVVGIISDTSSSFSWDETYYFHKDYFLSDTMYTTAYLSSNSSQVTRLELYKNDEIYIEGFYSSNPVAVDDTLPLGTIVIGSLMFEQMLDGVVDIDYDQLNQDMDECWNTYSYEEGKDDCWIQRERAIFQEYLDFFEANPNYFIGDDFELHATTNFYSNSASVTIQLSDEFSNRYEENSTAALTMSPATRDLLISQDKYQVTLLVEDSYDAKKVVDDLNDLEFRNIYPAGVQDINFQLERIFSTIVFGILFGLFLVVSYFVSYVVLRNIQISKKKDYLVFRSIGANRRDLNRITIFELMFSSLIAYVITYTIFYINDYVYNVFPRFLRYFNFGNHLVILALLMILAVLLGNRFNKRIFNRSVITALKQN